ncbi:MAG: SDR family NAD(P)-dependent oxidoreductase [Acidimicrobiales bacterium]
MGLLEGHKAIITGGANGIGAATARRFEAEGAAVALIDVDAEAGGQLATELGGSFHHADVTDAAALTGAVNSAVDAMGGLSDLFNNAGVGNVMALDAYDDAEWHRLVDTNMTAVFTGIRAAVPHLRHNGGGSIVTNASQNGLRPTRGEAPYSAAKAAAIALTQSGALEYGGDGIRVNAVLPGFVRTGLNQFICDNPDLAGPIEANTPLGRIGQPDEVADVVVFLCSHLARYVTGHSVVIDGGSLLVNAQVDPMLRGFLGH